MSGPNYYERETAGLVMRPTAPTARAKEKANDAARKSLSALMRQQNTAALDDDGWRSLLEDLINERIVREIMRR